MKSIHVLVGAGLVMCMMGITPSASAQETTFASDLPKVTLNEVNTYFRDIFGYHPSFEEWRYWATRIKDKPYHFEYEGAMQYARSKGDSPRLEDLAATADVTVDSVSPIIEGKKHPVVFKFSNKNTLREKGVVTVTISSGSVVATSPEVYRKRVLTGGVTELQFTYGLDPGQVFAATIDIIPSPVTGGVDEFTIQARWSGGQIDQFEEKISVLSAILDTPGLSSSERQVPFLFASVFGRSPNSVELVYWRWRLSDKPTLGGLAGAMEYYRSIGSTGSINPNATVVSSDINHLFRLVYDRTPTLSEWVYWASRMKDKATHGIMVDTMIYHRSQGILH